MAISENFLINSLFQQQIHTAAYSKITHQLEGKDLKKKKSSQELWNSTLD